MRNIIVVVTATLLTLTGTAQVQWPDHYHHNVLDNGLELLVVENKAVPLATIELAIKHGSAYETAATNGLSHLNEHLFFKTNEAFPTRDSLEREIENLGLVYNATTHPERLNYFINLNSSKLQEGIAFMAEATLNPKITQKSIDEEQALIQNKLKQAASNPVYYLIQDVNKKLWGSQSFRQNPMGTIDVIAAATPEKINAMHAEHITPRNSLLIVSGDVDHREVLQMVQAHFGSWKSSGNDSRTPPSYVLPSESSGVITLNENTQSPIILAAFQGPTTTQSKRASFSAEVLTYMLSQQTATLSKELVDAGLAYQIGVGYTAQKYGAPFTIFMVPQPGSISEAVAALESNIKRWNSADYFSDEEIENAKRMLTIQELYSRESPSEIVHNISYWWASADYDYFLDYTNEINQVTREDIASVVNNYIKGKPNATGILLSAEMKDILNLEHFAPLETDTQ